MVTCRIYLLTYKRNDLLIRAISGLKQQTFTNWVCELHDDDPANNFVENYLETLKDERFTYMKHTHRYGALKSFNLMYEGCNEDYVSLLEDDNWWEPKFLETLIDKLEANSNIQMAWSNMNLWKENLDKSWVSMNKTLWPNSKDITLFSFNHYKQAYSYLHSQGAMVVRNVSLQRLVTPLNIRLDFVEPVRERAFTFPIILIHAPLANFSITLSTNRTRTLLGVNEHYYLLLASYFKYIKPSEALLNDIWHAMRESTVRSTNKLIYAGLFDQNCRFLLRKANIKDILFFLLYNLKRPIIFYRCLFAKKIYRDLWNYLDENTSRHARS